MFYILNLFVAKSLLAIYQPSKQAMKKNVKTLLNPTAVYFSRMRTFLSQYGNFPYFKVTK
jgi:hypothetical protein